MVAKSRGRLADGLGLDYEKRFKTTSNRNRLQTNKQIRRIMKSHHQLAYQTLLIPLGKPLATFESSIEFVFIVPTKQAHATDQK